MEAGPGVGVEVGPGVGVEADMILLFDILICL